MKFLNLIKNLKFVLACCALLSLMTTVYGSPILVVGHKNPDSDAIFSAISLAYLKSQQGTPASAIAQGLPNPETQFALSYFGLKAPPVVLEVAGQEVILVDHNTYSQAPDDLKKATLIGIVDHHSLGDISTEEPIEVLIKPVGCTNTIIWQLYREAGVEIPPAIAGIMLSAILSDTLAFRSPTTTDLDQVAAKSLASIAGVSDIEQYAKLMFQAGESDLKSETISTLFQRDFKNFSMHGNKIGIGHLAAFNFDHLAQRKSEFIIEMKDLLSQKEYQTLVLMLTDIQKNGSAILIIGKNQDQVAQAFNMTLDNHSGWAPGVVSRKKQVVPLLEKVFKEN